MRSPRSAARRLPLALCVVAAAAICSTLSGPAATAVPASVDPPTYVPDPAWGLDPGFGDLGLARVPTPGDAHAVATQGQATWFAGSVVGKLTSSGALDTSVGRGRGFVDVRPPGVESVGWYSIVIDEQGRVVVAGSAYTPDSERVLPMIVARFTPDLELDQTFGDHGTRLITTRGSSEATDVQLQADGSIVVAGVAGSALQVARLTPSGDLDPTFGGGDGITTIGGDSLQSSGRGLSITRDAKIVVAGNVGRAAGTLRGAVVQLLPDGTPDPSFGDDGVAVVPGQALRDVVQLPGGNLVVVGSTANRDGVAAVRLVQLTNTGRLTAWPGTTTAQRTLVLGPLANVSPTSLALQHSGKLVIAGFGSRDASELFEGFLVVRTLTDGRPAAGFGDGGHLLIDWGATDCKHEADVVGEAVTVDDRDQIVVGGRVRNDTDVSAGPGVARFVSTSPALAPATALRETNIRGAWHACGTVSTDPCPDTVGTATTFGGRVWPAPDTEGLRLQVQRLDASDNTTTPMSTTPEGNFRTSITPTSPGHYRARVKVPDSGTTLLTAGAWRYFQVTS